MSSVITLTIREGLRTDFDNGLEIQIKTESTSDYKVEQPVTCQIGNTEVCATVTKVFSKEIWVKKSS